MRPKKHDTTRSGDLFRARLDQIINLKNELAQLAGASIQEIERVMAELANAREMLRREATRLQGGSSAGLKAPASSN